MLERKHFIIFSVFLVSLIYAGRLLQLQVFSEEYAQKAEKNIRVITIQKPPRGVITDRNGKLIVDNVVAYDLYVIPKQLEIEDTAQFCEFFNIDLEYAREKLLEAEEYSSYKPSLFIKELTQSQFASIQDRLTDYHGIFHVAYTVRKYPHQSLANALGYIKEVSPDDLKRDSIERYYRQGDMIGKSGLEKYYEQYLRGQRGVKYEMRNVRGVVKGKYLDGKFDTLPEAGLDLISSIDLDLQKYAEQLMTNKKGAVVAIEPSSGEILVMLSAPSYDPNLLAGSGKEVTKNYARLNADPHKLLFNRAIMSPYPPGSTFKTAMALVGLHDKAIDTTYTRFSCIKSMVNCHNHPGPLNVFGSIQHSCNPFYFQAYKKIILHDQPKDMKQATRQGLDEWNALMKTFGLGADLGIDLPYEHSGRIPSVKYYDRVHRGEDRWKLGNTYSIGIGQGEVGVTPLQLANLAACIANEGWYITPHMIKGIGEEKTPLPQFTEKHRTPIEGDYFRFVKRAMSAVTRAGTARRAFIEDIEVCGKTGTAQNPHGKDHSVFMAFAPRVNPKIAVAVYVENAGFGGTWAAPVASLMIEKYLRENFEEFKSEDEIVITRKWLEDYVLAGDLIKNEKLQ